MFCLCGSGCQGRVVVGWGRVARGRNFKGRFFFSGRVGSGRVVSGQVRVSRGVVRLRLDLLKQIRFVLKICLTKYRAHQSICCAFTSRHANYM